MAIIFLIGPGGVGKTTVGKILAEQVGAQFIDLDQEFCLRIANIREFIKAQGYEVYLEKNAALLALLHGEVRGTHTVLALSSGFLSTDIRPDIVRQNRQQVHEWGLSVLLMPSRNIEEACRYVVERQLRRGFGLSRDKEAYKFCQRFGEYSQLGDVQIFSMASPEAIASLISDTLQHRMSSSPDACG